MWKQSVETYEKRSKGMMKIYNYLLEEIEEKGAIHLSLIDPERVSLNDVDKIARAIEKGGSSAIMVGGSIGVMQCFLDEVVKEVKSSSSLPVILFPGDLSGISRHADAIFFMSLLNSRNPYYIIGAQALGAPLIKKLGIEAIPMGYIVVEPGGTVGYVGDARLVPRKKPEIALSYALAAQFMGMKLVYLEAGSGAEEPIPVSMVKVVSENVDIPVIAGGGIKAPEQARDLAEAGAKIIVTGTVLEKAKDVEETVRRFVKAVESKKI